MKNINQLKKEIRDIKGNINWLRVNAKDKSSFKIHLKVAEAKLQTLQQVCEEIEDWKKDEHGFKNEWDIFLDAVDELLNKFKGEEK